MCNGEMAQDNAGIDKRCVTYQELRWLSLLKDKLHLGEPKESKYDRHNEGRDKHRIIHLQYVAKHNSLHLPHLVEDLHTWYLVSRGFFVQILNVQCVCLEWWGI